MDISRKFYQLNLLYTNVKDIVHSIIHNILRIIPIKLNL